ncbi:hypothetical protein [Candidatus Chromulinivorax destructor]|uniref:Autotransporter outer membrane beta-barrel domain-containing protein n=1 Tax=Candidatus Chromulinivorax destructor TaxID=2066483 RepID=A0A345ZAH6_9BACT|nr:hypothetical protein [Candidatus Chromulinivorax destructor]AXK60293.1 hypothetical protein C0J27_00815 [Candidatus Chromulinivorax destructor]
MVNKSMKKLFVGLAVLSTAASLHSEAVQSTSKGFFQPRAASANIAREMLMQPNEQKHSDGWYGNFSATGFYQRGWNDNSVDSQSDADSNVSGLGAFPFWSGTNTMAVGNSATTAAGIVAGTPSVDGYQFGLGTTSTAGSINLNPIVYQAGADFMFIVGSASHEPGFLFKIKAPIAVYNINPNLTEVAATPAANYNEGQLSLSTTDVAIPTGATMTQALAGNLGDAPTLGNYTPMQYGLVQGDISTGAKFGDIEMTAGYNFISNEDSSFSVALRASAPTGNKATGQYMLEPIVGRGGNWGLGGYTAAHVNLWEGSNDNRLSFKVMADVMHLFGTDTVRSYDLTENGGGSRYLLVADYNAGVYQNSIQNLINVTTLASTSSFGVEGDVAVGFNYTGGGFSFDLGYEFFGRSAETLEITGDFNTRYAVLGHQGPGTATDGSVASFAAQPGATMRNAVAQTDIVQTGTVATTADALGDARLTANQVSLADLNVEGAQQSAYLTSKIFAKVGYEFAQNDYVPFVGVMGEFEFSNSLNNALPQWSVALVGGVSF